MAMFIRGASGPVGHPKLHTYEEGRMLPVLSGSDLLFSSRHKGLMRQIRDLAGLPEEDYQQLYGRTLEQFFEFVQVLPQKQNGVLGSMLNYGLARAVIALQKFCQQKNKKPTPLLKFAVFTAALLRDVGKVVSQQHITLVDESGEYIEDWNSLSGSMVGRSAYYKIYQIAKRYFRIESEVTPLLARQLIPREGFLWLSSDLGIFSDWLAALLDEEGVGGKEITWALSLIRREDLVNLLTTLDGASVDMEVSETTEYGEAFLSWLKEQIESGELPVNADEASIHLVEQGVLLERKLFKQFVDVMNMPVNWQVVYNQVGNLMGIPKKCGDDFLHAQFFSVDEVASSGKVSTFASALGQRTSHQYREGMLLNNSDLVFLSKLPSTNYLIKSVQTVTPDFHKQPPSLGLQNDLSADFKAKS